MPPEGLSYMRRARQARGRTRERFGDRDGALGFAVWAAQAEFWGARFPWWAGFLLVLLGLCAVCLRIVFPQDSPDRLAWWLDRRRTGLARKFGADEPSRQPTESHDGADC